MSFYRTLIATVAALSLATSVFAADEATTQNPADATSTTQTTTTTTSNATTTSKLDINTATEEELSKVNGLNSKKAKMIVDYREKLNAHGSKFNSLNDLRKVKLGLSPKQMKEVKSQLTVG